MSIPGHRLSRTQECRPMPHVCAAPSPGGCYSWSRGHPRKDTLLTPASRNPSFTSPSRYPQCTSTRGICSVRMPTAKFCLFYKLVLKPRKQKKVAGSRLHIGDLVEEPACPPASMVVCVFGLRRWNSSLLLALPRQGGREETLGRRRAQVQISTS